MTKYLNRRAFMTVLGGSLGSAFLAACSSSQELAADKTTEQRDATSDAATGIDYMALVNKTHELPEGWEDAVEIVSLKNSEDWDVDVEAKAYDAYLELKADLESDDVYVDLDSAYRSVEAQQKIVDEFTEKYGKEYVKLYVAVPGYSELHTGLALDLFLIIDGKGVYYNEDMVQYPEIWEKIHAKLADHGFILRYLPGKKIETGYSYEPWHIRYLDDVDVARQIMDEGITLERYLDALDPMTADCEVDYGTSKLYTEADMDSALDAVLEEFRNWDGCELKRFAFAGDDTCGTEELAYANSLRSERPKEFTQAIVFKTDFHSPSGEKAEGTAWEPDSDYQDWEWHLARTDADGAWVLLTWGY